MPNINLENIDKWDDIFEESIRVLRSNILFCGKEIKTILFTSCEQNEGKSEVSVRTAISMAEMGKKVLFIDADIRKSVFVSRYRISKEVNGLSQYLSGQKPLEEIIYQTNYKNLDIIFSGPLAPNPSELLGSASFEKLLMVERGEYDYLFIDTPPLGLAIDAAVVSQHCDGGIFVIADRRIRSKAAKKVKSQLEAGHCRWLGAVLNFVDMKKNGYYAAYGYGYGYGSKTHGK